MKTTYSTKTDKVTVTLSDLERRQMLSLTDATAGKILKEQIAGAVVLTQLIRPSST